MTGKRKFWLTLGSLLVVAIIIQVIAGSAGRNKEYVPIDEFQLHPWISIHIGGVDMSINKAVVFLLIAAILTIASMLFVANRMQARPNRTQTAVETVYQAMKTQIADASMEPAQSKAWFPFIGTLFLFIWFSNMIGYLPLPTSHDTFNVFGVHVPSFALYAATANISVPLVLTLIVWISYQVVGIRAKGPVKYFKGWIPAGTSGPLLLLIVPVEIISQFVRIVSLSVRLFANILAGHLLILFMGGGLAVMLGLAALSVITVPAAILFFLFEIGLVATLQAFIFATLASIYLGEAVSDHH